MLDGGFRILRMTLLVSAGPAPGEGAAHEMKLSIVIHNAEHYEP